MANVSVEKSAVVKSIALCNRTIQHYKQTAAYMEKQYREAGNGWHDAKYAQLGAVVNDCTTALKSPVAELEDCLRKLNELLKAIERYESENL